MSRFPESDPISKPFWDGAREGRLKVQHCRSCDKHIHYPRTFCPHCMSSDLDWTESSGQGKIHAFTVVYRHWDKSFSTPFVVALVALGEGVVMTSTIIGVEPNPEKIRIGMPVELVDTRHEAEPSLPSFRVKAQV